METNTDPLPEPEPDAVTQGSELLADHEHPDGAVTLTLVEPPWTGNVTLEGLMLYVQLDRPSCGIETATGADATGSPAIVIVPVRGSAPELGATEKFRMLVPV